MRKRWTACCARQAGCRQGLLEGTWCLNPDEALSPGQAGEIERVWRMYPHLNDDDFVAQNLQEWMVGL